MGNYASTSELLAQFQDELEVAHLTGDVADGTPETTDLDDALEWAEGRINMRIGQRFLTPVTVATSAETGRLLKRSTLRLAAIALIRRGPGLAQFKRDEETEILAEYDRVARGELTLPGAVTLPSTASREPRLSWSDSTRMQPDDSGRLFTRDSASRL